MKFLFGLLIFGLTINQATAAEVIAEKAVTATHFNVEEETEYKPWSLNMGISTLDGIDMNEQKMRGQGDA